MELSKEDIEFKRKVEGIDLEALDNAYKKAWGVTNTQPYYKGKDSLYKFAEDWGLNAYEFDILKRVVRCRHKGEFKKDLEKTKDLIDIYLKEHEQLEQDND